MVGIGQLTGREVRDRREMRPAVRSGEPLAVQLGPARTVGVRTGPRDGALAVQPFVGQPGEHGCDPPALVQGGGRGRAPQVHAHGCGHGLHGLEVGTGLPPRDTIQETAAKVSTLLTTVGASHSPRWVGYGGRGRAHPRSPSKLAIRAVSSPATYDPAPSTTSMSKAVPVPWTDGPKCPSAYARATASRILISAHGYSERTSTSPWRAPHAKQARARPSSTRSGSSSINSRSAYEPGSPSSPLATTTVPGARPAVSHFVATMKPAPPRPRNPDAATSRWTWSGVPVVTACGQVCHAGSPASTPGEQYGVARVVGHRDPRRQRRLTPRELTGQRRARAGGVAVERCGTCVAVPQTAHGLE